MPRAQLQLAWKTQAGQRHHFEGLDNEDAVFVTDEHPYLDGLLLVADGMGGHPRPREASESAVQAAREVLFDPERFEEAAPVQEIVAAAFQAAQRAVRSLASGPGKPPGTTLSAAVVAEGVLHVTHVGDGSVFLMRRGQVRVLTGGEERRTGNRPAQFLGQGAPLQPETREIPLEKGDRVLLCTDGLTRYFREAGPEALERVLGRQGVEVQAIAGQLTAHSRPDEYADDTTVALFEVEALTAAQRRPRAAPERAPGEAPLQGRRVHTMRETPAPRRKPAVPLGSAVAGMVAGALLLAGGFAAGRATAPAAPLPEADTAAEPRETASPEALRRLPAGNLVLVDALGGRVYALPTGDSDPGQEPLRLQALRVTRTGQLTPVGQFTLDPGRRHLRDAAGNSYPVEISGGTVRIVRGGEVAVQTKPPGAALYLDGRRVGLSPRSLTLPAGSYRVEARGRDWRRETRVEVIPGGSVSVTLAAP